MDDPLVIAGKEFRSRLMVGTGRHRTMEEMVESIEASGAEIITVAIRRLNLDNPNEKSILDYFDWNKYTILPNTAACSTAEEAVFVAKLARELTGSNWVKLEVIPDAKWLLPDPIGTFEAAKILVDDGFVVLPYIHADPVLAARAGGDRLRDGHAAGIRHRFGTGHSHARRGQDHRRAVLRSGGRGTPGSACLPKRRRPSKSARRPFSSTLRSRRRATPAGMGEAFKLGVQAGRMAYLAGRIERKDEATASSPTTGVVQAAAARR